MLDRYAPVGEAHATWWTIAAHTYRAAVRTQWFIATTFFLPVVIGLALYLPTTIASRETPTTTALYNISVIDATTTGVGERVAQLLGGGKYANQPMPEVRVVSPAEIPKAESLALQNAQAQRASGYLLLDSTTLATGTARYVGRQAHDEADILKIEDAVREGVIGHRLHERGLGSMTIDSITIVEPGLVAEPLPGVVAVHSENRLMLAVALGLVLFVTIALYSRGILNNVVRERWDGFSNPMFANAAPRTVFSGTLIGLTAIGVTQLLVWIILGSDAVIAAGKLIAPIDPMIPVTGEPESVVMRYVRALPLEILFSSVAFFILGVAGFGGLYASAVTRGSEAGDSTAVPRWGVLIFVAIALGMQVVIIAPSSMVSHILSLVPLLSSVLMPLRLAASAVRDWEVVTSLVLSALACLGILRYTMRRYANAAAAEFI